MIVRGVLLLGFLLLPPIQAACRSRCDSQIFTCSVTRVTRRECRNVENAPVTSDHSISTKSHRTHGVRHTQISWTPREFEGRLLLPGNKVCYKISITKTREGGAAGGLRVRCVARGGRPRLYDMQGHTAVRIAHRRRELRNLSTSTGRQSRCVTPRRLETKISGGDRLTVKWGDYEGSSKLNVSILRLPDHDLVSSSTLDITSRAGHPAKGKVHFDSFSPSPGQYVAVIIPVGCPSDCKRESATFEWPPSKEAAPASSRRYRHTCTCWTPDIVLMRVWNASVDEVEVEWTGNYSDRDLKVGVVRAGQNSVFASQTTLTVPKLKSMKTNSVRLNLSSKVPGEYTALVGSTGCASCMRYRESQRFFWPPPPPSSSETPPSSTARGSSTSDYGIKTLTAVFVVTGVLAFIMVVAVGVIISRKCSRKPVKKRRSREPTLETILLPDPQGLECIRFPLVVYQPNTEELHNAAERLANGLEQVGLSPRIHSLQDELKSSADLIMHITSRGEMERIPAQLRTMQDRTVTVGVNLVKGSLSPSVSVPRNFFYSDVPNDLTSLVDFLKLFGDPATVKTLVVCSGENDRQLATCELLVSLLDQPPLQLVFPDHTQCRNELKENTDEWFETQIREARFILAIVPEEIDSDESSSNMTRFLNTVLHRARASQTVLKKIVLVSLGDHCNKMTVQRPYLSTCPSFDLLWNSNETRPLMLPLVEHLCGGTDILHQACCQSDVERICGWQQDSELRVALRNLCTGEAEESV